MILVGVNVLVYAMGSFLSVVYSYRIFLCVFGYVATIISLVVRSVAFVYLGFWTDSAQRLVFARCFSVCPVHLLLLLLLLSA